MIMFDHETLMAAGPGICVLLACVFGYAAYVNMKRNKP